MLRYLVHIIFFFLFLPSLNCISWLLTRSEGFELRVPSPQKELPGREVKEDEEAEGGWASSADGHDFTQGAKLLTTSITGEQTKIPLKCQTNCLLYQPANLFAVQALGQSRYRATKSAQDAGNAN